jgi:hypothetical protein
MEIVDPRMQFTKNEYLTFKLNEHEKIIIKFNVNDVLHCCYRAKFFFVRYNHKILLQDWTINEDLKQFIQVLDPAIKCQLSINSEFTNEIGHLWNYVCNKKKSHDRFSEKTKKERKKFTPYLAFQRHDFTTWIYNDSNGNIIFKITPLFKSWKPRRKQPKYITFLHWMKNYKPILIRIIPKDIAEQWLDQANQIYNVVKNNIEIIGLISMEEKELEIEQAKANGTYDEQAIKIANDELAQKQREIDKMYAEKIRKAKENNL